MQLKQPILHQTPRSCYQCVAALMISWQQDKAGARYAQGTPHAHAFMAVHAW